jgi:hypothetical protein
MQIDTIYGRYGAQINLWRRSGTAPCIPLRSVPLSNASGNDFPNLSGSSVQLTAEELDASNRCSKVTECLCRRYISSRIAMAPPGPKGEVWMAKTHHVQAMCLSTIPEIRVVRHFVSARYVTGAVLNYPKLTMSISYSSLSFVPCFYFDILISCPTLHFIIRH